MLLIIILFLASIGFLTTTPRTTTPKPRYEDFLELLTEQQVHGSENDHAVPLEPGLTNYWNLIKFFLKPHKKNICFLTLLYLNAAAQQPIQTFLIKQLTTSLARDGNAQIDLSHAIIPTILLLVYTTGSDLLEKLADLKANIVTTTIKRETTLILAQYIQGHSGLFFQNNSAGSLAQKMSTVAVGIPALLDLTLRYFLHIVSSLGIVTAQTWKKDERAGLTTAAWIIVTLWLFSKLSGKSTHLAQQIAEDWDKVNDNISDSITNMSSIHAFTGKKHETSILQNKLEQLVETEAHASNSTFMRQSLQGFAMNLYSSIILGLTIAGLQTGQTVAEDIPFVLETSSAVAQCLSWLPYACRESLKHWSSVVEGFKTILQPHCITTKPGAKKLIVNHGEIIFDRVLFKHTGAINSHFESNIVIQAGEKIGVVGSSGSGKSTFIGLLLRLYEASSGAILIDKQNITEVTLNSLRKNIALVPQNTLLFNRTILENIRYGRLNASNEEVIAAATQAHIHDFISLLPLGYNTTVGEYGAKLSGGQRQRVAIARAILKKAPILILDEATSALDSITENLIQESLQNLMQNCTTIIIAHRLATLKTVDRVVVFDEGRIIDLGTHEQLLQSCEKYKNLWNAQTNGLLEAGTRAGDALWDIEAHPEI